MPRWTSDGSPWQPVLCPWLEVPSHLCWGQSGWLGYDDSTVLLHASSGVALRPVDATLAVVAC